jgi:DNA-binding response OmpR family regulator
MPDTVLVADRDAQLCDTIAAELAADGYSAVGACAEGALALGLANHHPDLVVLGDFDAPAATARLLRALRAAEHPLPEETATVPVVVLSGGAGQLALLRCFEAGADDYLAKPACYLELRARIRAVLARAGGSRAPALRRVGGLVLDTATRRASYAGTEVALSRLEWRLLAQLSEQPGRVYTKHELLREIWGCDAEQVRTRTVDAHACRLRRRLELAGAVDPIANTRGVGYALSTANAHTAP